MNYLNRKQFDHLNRYNRVGLGKDDVTGMVGVVRKIQANEMKESGKVGDVTFTFWFVPTTKPGTVLRACAMGLLAEEAEKLQVGDVVKLDFSIIPSGWVKVSQITFVSGKSRPAEQEEHIETLPIIPE